MAELFILNYNLFLIIILGCQIQLSISKCEAGQQAQCESLHPGLQPLRGQPGASIIQGNQLYPGSSINCPSFFQVRNNYFSYLFESGG